MNHKMCRVCRENSGNLNIFETDCNGVLICSKIMYCCAKLEITENDGLPSYICNHCEEDLATACRFVTKCEATDRILRSQISDTNTEKNSSTSPKHEVKCEQTDLESNTSNDETHNYILPDELELSPTECEKSDQKARNTIKNAVKLSERSSLRSKRIFNNVKGPQNCSICNRACANPSTLIIHMRSHTNEKPYQCELCNKKYKDPNTLKRHSIRNHLKAREKRFICENCGKGFCSTTEIINHLRTHTGETPFACSECPSCFTQLSSLIRHRKKHRGEKTEICNICSKRFCTKDQLKRHLQVHTSSKQFSCPICPSVFKYKNNLTKHYKLHSEPNSYVCNHCGRSFNTKGNLKIHIKRVHSDKSGFCKTCSKVVSNIEVHTWKHTGERPLKCELCTKSFYETKALSHHMNFRHKHIDKYKCSVENCPRTFPSKAMLDFHVAKLHESRFIFPCNKCPRGFYRKSDLARHMIGTHKEKLL